MTKRTTDQWAALLDGATPAPWAPHPDFPEHLINENNTVVVAAFLEHETEDAANKELVAAAPEAVAELVRLRRALEEFLRELNDDLAHEGIEDYSDIDDAWPSMQEYGELTVKLAHRNILTRILERHNDE